MSVPPANSRILYPEQEIERMVDRLAVKLNVDLEGQTPVFACLLKGAIPFTWDLMRRMKVDLTLSYIRVQRFKGKVGGTPRISHFDAEEFSGQTVVVVDSVLDEGHTLEVVHEVLNPLVRKLITVVLIQKKTEYKGTADYVGFHAPNHFLFGRGMDLGGKYRDLPDVYELID